MKTDSPWLRATGLEVIGQQESGRMLRTVNDPRSYTQHTRVQSIVLSYAPEWPRLRLYWMTLITSVRR